MNKWSIGDFAVIQSPHLPPAGVVEILCVAELPDNEYEKYFGVKLVTALLDWSASDVCVARRPGEVFNAHFAELHDMPFWEKEE